MRPRSSGCRVCVSRRIRCDLTRPSCMRCKVAGRVCDGYDSRFILEDPGKSASVSVIRTQHRATKSVEDAGVHELSRSKTSGSAFTSGHGTTLLDFNRLSITISRLGNYTEDVFCKFFLDQTVSFGTWVNNRQWMHEVLQSPSHNPVALPALRCLITAFFGHAHQDVNMKTQAATLYSQAIVALKQNLENEAGAKSPSRPFPSFQLLAATLLLLLYEYFAVTPPRGWIRHANGLETLIRLRGPGYFKHAGSRQQALLRMARIPLQTESIRAQKSCFLDFPDWRAVWVDSQEVLEQHDAGSDGDESQVHLYPDVVDITAGLGAILEEVQRIKDMDLDGQIMWNRLSHLTELQDSLIRMENDLSRWWESNSQNLANMPIAMTVETSDTPSISSISTLSGTFLSFRSMIAAHDFCRYHTFNILILLCLIRLRSLLPGNISSNGSFRNNETTLSSIEPFPSIPRPSEYASVNHPNVIRMFSHARAICDTLPMYTLPQYQHIGGLWAAFPARIAWQVFPTSSKESLWIEAFLNMVADASGFEFNRHLCRPL